MTIEIWKYDTIAIKYLISSTGLVDALTRFTDTFSCYLDEGLKIYQKAYNFYMWRY